MTAPARQIPQPPIHTRIGSIAWMPSGQMVIAATYKVWYRLPDSAHWQPLPVAHDPICQGFGYSFLTPLPDGRLGMVCAAGLSNSRVLHAMVAYDWSTQTVTSIVSGTLPNSGGFSWKSDMSRGVFGTSGEYPTLYWVSAQGTAVVPVTLTKDGRSWSFPDSIVAFERFLQSPLTKPPVHPVGLVRDPAWSPDGTTIAFWATLETIGRPFHFPSVPWDIYVLDATTLHVERVLEGVVDPATLAWSPDGAWLLYRSWPGDTHPQGLWIFSTRTRQSTLIAEGYYAAAAWSPDGQAILAPRCTDDLCKSSEMWLYDVHSIVSAK